MDGDSELQSPIPGNHVGGIGSQHSRNSDASSILSKDDRASSEGFNMKDADLHIERLTGGDHNRKVIVSKRKILW